MGRWDLNYMFLYYVYHVPVWESTGHQFVYQLPCLWKQGFLKQGYLVLCAFIFKTILFSIYSFWQCWVVSFKLFPIQGFYFVHVHVGVCAYFWVVFVVCLLVCLLVWMWFWNCDRNRSGIWVAISHFGLSSFVALWTDKALPGHHWQLRSKQFPPLPQQAQSTVLHRNLFILFPFFPFLPGLKLAISEFIEATEVFHIHTESVKDEIKRETER